VVVLATEFSKKLFGLAVLLLVPLLGKLLLKFNVAVVPLR
jgi:hypothetical protein